MSRAERVSVLGEASAWVGKCAACRFSQGGDLFGEGGLHCAHLDNEGGPRRTRPQWSCPAYEYEPGAAA